MIYLAYLVTLLKHKWFVFVAGLRVGGMLVHDLSKFSRTEFGSYARYQMAMKNKESVTEEVQLGFAYGWLHHENTNPHHWGYWIPRSGRFEAKPLAMPSTYIREMVADWLGASRAYTGSWDMTEWLQSYLAWRRSYIATLYFICISS